MTSVQIGKEFSGNYPKLAAALATYGVEARDMAESFPRLLKTIDAGWGAADCLHYIDGLLFSDRVYRQGFPNEVIDELLLIKNIFEASFPAVAVNRNDPFSKVQAAETFERIKALAALVKDRAEKSGARDKVHNAAQQARRENPGGEVTTVEALNEAIARWESGPLLGRREHRRLGEYLVEQGLVDPDVLARALNYQSRVPARHLIGEILLAENSLSAHQLNRALCLQRGVPIVDAAAIEISPEAVRLVPLRIARMKSAMPITLYGHHLVVAVSDPFDPEAHEYFSFLGGASALLVYSTPERIGLAQANYGHAPAPDNHRPGRGNVSAGSDAKAEAPHSAESPSVAHESDAWDDGEEDQAGVESTLPGSIDENDESVIGLVNKVINDAIRVGASDIHFEAFPRVATARIRFRKDGVMEAHSEYPIAYHAAVVSRLKIMADLDISEKRKSQDGRIAFGQGMRKLDLRVSTIPTSNPLEIVTIRLLSSGKPLPLNRIGMHPATQAVFREQIVKPYGLILVCGPTGSGKTTTLHSVLRELNTPERKLWTAEDPVEIVQKNVSQVQVLPKIGWTFANALRAFLRADPDVIMVGEIRDAETAKVAVEASMTGHLVLSTVHTNSAAETLGRLLDLDVQAFNLADAVQAVLAQRLARRVCPECGERFEFNDEELDTLVTEYWFSGSGKVPTKADREKLLTRWRAEFVGEGLPLTGTRVVGCSACNGTGYKGRLGIHELLVMTPELRRQVRSGATTGDLFRQAIKDGMKTLRQDGIEKAVQGLTDLSEVRSVCL